MYANIAGNNKKKNRTGIVHKTNWKTIEKGLNRLCVSVYVRAREEGGMIKEEHDINLRLSWGA